MVLEEQDLSLLEKHIEHVNWARLASLDMKDWRHELRVVEHVATMQFSAVEIKELRSQFDEVLGQLHEAWSKVDTEDMFVSLDRKHDMICHVVGLGLGEVEAALKSPTRLLRRYQKQAFVEGFQYTVPFVESLREITTTHYMSRAWHMKAELEGYTTGGQVPSASSSVPDFDNLREDLQEKIRWMANAVADFNNALQQDLSLEEWQQKLIDTESFLREQGIVHGYGAQNMIKEYRAFVEARERVFGDN